MFQTRVEQFSGMVFQECEAQHKDTLATGNKRQPVQHNTTLTSPYLQEMEWKSLDLLFRSYTTTAFSPDTLKGLKHISKTFNNLLNAVMKFNSSFAPSLRYFTAAVEMKQPK